MLSQNHTADPYPQSVESYQCGQQFAITGPDQTETGSQCEKKQPPYADAKDQAGHYDHCLGQPTQCFYYVVVCPIFATKP